MVDVASVLGFENAAQWSSSQGIKTSSSVHSQGSASLAISNFTFTNVTSVALPTLSGVSSTLALDVRLPATVSWGQVQLFVTIPSQNLYEQALPAATLVGLPAGSFSTLSFAVPAALQQKLSAAYNDLTIRVAVNVPQTSQSLLIDNLRFVQPSTQANKVEVQVDSADDSVTAYVDGVRRDSWAIFDSRLGVRTDVSSWFGAGTHSLRFIGGNSGGPVNYKVRVWADNTLVYDSQCPACDGTEKPQDISFDQTLQLSTPSRPAPQNVQITSTTPGKIYLDNGYTGLSTTGTSTPVTLALPPGTYKLGLGTSNDTAPNYTGEYREQQITVASAAVSVNLSSAPKLSFTDSTNIVVVPIRHTIVDPTGQTGNLTNEDVTAFQAQVNATRSQWLEPFSYGLNTWNVTFRPVVEDVPVHVKTTGSGIDTDPFLCAAGLTSLRQNYDIVVFLWNLYDDSGAGLPVDFSAYGGGGQVWMNTYWTRRSDWPHTGPNPALLHEVLHNYEGYNSFNLGFYNGVNQLHGAAQHGYYNGSNGELDFALWQRAYIRGQVGELLGMQPGQNWPAPVTSNPDAWVGVFDTVRRGYNPSPGSVDCSQSAAVSSFAASSAPSGTTSSQADAVRCPKH